MTKDKFKKIRLSMGVSQAKFAEMLGYDTFQTVWRKEKGIFAITRQDEIILESLLAKKAVTAKPKPKPSKKLA